LKHSIKRSGTILDLLKTDFRYLLNKKEDFKEMEVINKKIKYTDFHYLLAEKELGVFDKTVVRLFDQRRHFDTSLHTHLTFTTSSEPSLKKMVTAIETLINLYRTDEFQHLDLDLSELEVIEKRDYWPGRNWNFNINHQLWKINDPEELFSYAVSIYYDSYEEGFTMRIFGYNNLIAHFG
jgi:hypothetical protein